MSKLIHRIHTQILEHALIMPGQTVVVGLSGGPDSVFLLHVLAELQKELACSLVAAHLNHGWRAEASDEAAWCAQFASQLKVPYIMQHVRDVTVTKQANGSQEAEGRNARRAFFETVAQEHGAQKIALAHHADDQLETFFIRLARGASLDGLCGMLPQDGVYIRPLLEISKTEIVAYLAEHQLSFCVDASNNSHDFLRNRIRHILIPALESVDPRYARSTARTMQQLNAAEDFCAQATAEGFGRVCSENALNAEKLFKEHPYLQRRIVMAWLIAVKVPFAPSEGFFNEILRFIYQSAAQSHALAQSYHIMRADTLFLIKKINSSALQSREDTLCADIDNQN